MKNKQCSSCGGFCGRGGCKVMPVKTYSGGVPLYTAPPTRKPLTDDELENAIQSAPSAVFALMKGNASASDLRKALLLIARAIERAHGIGSD